MINAPGFERDLGVIIDEKLSCESHINQKVALANSKSRRILKTFTSCDPFLLFRLFRTYIIPILDYCSEITSPKPNSKLCHTFESPLRNFTREIFQRCNIPFESYTDRLNFLETRPLYYRRIKTDILQALKLLIGQSQMPTNYLVRSSLPRDPQRLIFPRNVFLDHNWYFNSL